MRLQSLTLYHYNRPFEYSFKSSHANRLCADSVIVVLKFDSGITGIGESAPRDYVTGETQKSVCQSIITDMAPLLFQLELKSLADIEHVLTTIEQKNPIPEKRCLSAIGSIDLALLDALGQYKGHDVGQFFDMPVRNQVPFSLSIPLITPKNIQEKWRQLRNWLPIKSIKVVVSGSVEANLDRYALIRDVIGSTVDMRIEVNGKWTYTEACKNLAAMRDLDISGVEEPLIAADRDKLHQLRSDFGIPVVLDESICTREDAKRAIHSRSCDVINVKVSKCGGLIRSQEIVRMAAKADIACQIGTHVGESIILDSAGWHLALATAKLTYFEGCSFLLHKARPSIEGESQSRQSRTGHPGWGLTQGDINDLLASCDRLDQIDA